MNEMQQPLVTVNILSFNRRDELRHTLGKVFGQDYRNIEVIVVENASTDGSAEMVRREFPQVILIALERNIGIAGWNDGFNAARGEYILVLDDDSYPQENAIALAVRHMTDHRECGVAAFSVFNTGWKRNEIEGTKARDIDNFVGCGALIRKEIFPVVGMFDDQLFLYLHEIEFSMRVYAGGFTIKFLPECRAIHHLSDVQRTRLGRKRLDKRKLYYFNRNWMLILTMRFPMEKVIARIFRIAAGRLLFGMLNGAAVVIMRGLSDGLLLSWKHRRSRRLLPESIQRMYSYGAGAGGFFFSDGQYGFRNPFYKKKLQA